jgi:hypothetical protein
LIRKANDSKPGSNMADDVDDGITKWFLISYG